MMERICIKEFMKDGLIFAKGVSYRVSYNPVDGRIYIYNPFGYTDISKQMLDYHFM